MSLYGALSNAFSGLKANARAASLVATNISNATTESYGRRELDLTAAQAGTVGGVRINGVTRHVDAALLSDRRMSDAALGYGDAIYTFNSRLENLAGNSDSPGSLVQRVSSFENSLLTAASNPASAQRLETVAFAANAMADTFNALAQDIQEARGDADRSIASMVETLNTGLSQVKSLNADIVAGDIAGADVASLYDERQRVIDSISDVVPMRVVERDRGEVALFTMGGALLLDGLQPEIGFSQTQTISADMTLAGGQLSSLTYNGQTVNTTQTGMFAGGALAAQFEVRDELAVERQAELDGIARDVIERLGPGGPDTTLGVGDPGLFTDAGIAFDPVNEVGISERMRLNTLVEPGGGGTWRLRDGLGAVVQGEVGNASLLNDLTASISTALAPGSAALTPVARTFSDRVADYSSSLAGARVRSESNQVFYATQNTALKELELSKGVDTDAELQRLMQIEQLYTANARVMTVVDELMQRLMSI